MKRLTLLIAALALLASPTAALATIHYGSVTFEPPVEEPTIGPQPPPCNPQETSEESRGHAEGPEGYRCKLATEGLHTVNVAYNDQAGTLTVKVAVYDPQLWGPVLAQQGFTLVSRCNDLTLAPSLEGNFAGQADRYARGGYIEGQEENSVTLQGHNGSVGATAAFGAQGYTFTWSDRAFAHRDWRFLELNGGGCVRLGGWPASHRRHR